MEDRISEVVSIVLLVVIGLFLALVRLVSRKAQHNTEAKIAAFDQAFLEGVK